VVATGGNQRQIDRRGSRKNTAKPLPSNGRAPRRRRLDSRLLRMAEKTQAGKRFEGRQRASTASVS